jgi:hypothetical protein
MFFLCCGILYGKQNDWVMLGVCLCLSIMNAIYFAFSLLILKIDKRFDQLEKRLNLKEQTANQTTDS